MPSQPHISDSDLFRSQNTEQETAYESASSSLDPVMEQEIRRLENTSHKSIWKQKPLLAAVAFLVILTVSSVGALAYIYFLPQNSDNNQQVELGDKINVESTDPVLVDQLKEALVYGAPDSVEQTGQQKYYSPSIDTLVLYSADKYIPQEENKGVYFTLKQVPTDSFGNFARMFVVEKKDLNDNINRYFEKYYDYQEGLETVSSENGEINKLHLKYSQTNYVNQTKVEKHRVLYSREEANVYLIVELVFDKDLDLEDYELSLTEMLKQAKLNPDLLDQQIQIVLSGGGVGLSFDREKWEMGFYSETSANLTFRNAAFEKEELTGTYTTMSVQTFGVYEEVTSNYLNSYIQTTLKDNAQALYQDRNYGEEKQFTEKHAELDFNVFSYTYTSGLSQAQKTYAYHYLLPLNNQRLLEVIIRTESADSNGLTEAKEILDALKVDQSAPGEAVSKQGEVLGITSSEFDTAALVGKPAVVHIFNRSCVQLEVRTDKDLPTVGGQKFKLCTAGLGSGSFLSKDGYIITNSHVATPNVFDIAQGSLDNNLEDSSDFWTNFGQDVNSILKANGKSTDYLSETEMRGVLLQAFFSLKEDNTLKLTPEYTNYIELNKPFKLDQSTYEPVNKKLYALAKTVATRGNDSVTEIAIKAAAGRKAGVETPDLALLKIEPGAGVEYPSLELADPETVSLGTQISAIGFPVSANNQSLYSLEASSIPTITKGNISSIKPSYNNKFQLIEIDASISGGNSGGPILNSNGQLVGVATYGANPSADEGADFNAGVFVREVLDLVQENNITLESGNYNKYLKQGLSDFDKSYYVEAKANLEQAVELYEPSKSVLIPLIKIAEAKIQAGESLDPNADKDSGELINQTVQDNRWLIIGSLVGVALVSIIIILLVVLIAKNRKQAKERERVLKLQELYYQRQIQQNTQNQAPRAPQQTYPAPSGSFYR